MKVSKYIWLVFVAICSCREENPSPTSFLEYSSPYYENVDANVLSRLDDEIKKGAFGDIHSLLIIRNDKIVFENYYSNYRRDDLHPIGSSTQSIVSTLVGIVDHTKESFSISDKIIDFFPEYPQYFDNIPQKDQIEIRHLLSHTSGLWWDEWTHPFGSEDNDAYVMSISDDWVANVLSTPMIREPGSDFNFNSGNSVLMAPLLEKVTEMDLEEFAQIHLFSPLDITEWKWERIPGDHVNSAWGLHMKPIDLAKIGYLFLNEGRWQNNELFAENWQTRSTRRRLTVSSYYGYGYYWWSFTNVADIALYLGTNDAFFSWGEGGQFLFVVPHLNLVVATTAGNYNGNETKAIEMLRDYIIVAISDKLF